MFRLWLNPKNIVPSHIIVMLHAHHLKTKDCDGADLKGSGSTRPGTNSAPESTRPRVNTACLFSLW